MEITAKMVAELRQMTGVGMMECKKALTEANGDMDKAVKILNEQGKAKAAKKAGRIAAEGVFGYYDHMNMHKTIGLVELLTETDFAAKNPIVPETAKNIAMHAVATKPLAVRPEDLSADYIAEQREIFIAQLKNDPKYANKPQEVLSKIVEGKMNKLFEEVCLLKQPYVRDPDKTIEDLINELTLVIGEKITIRRFLCWEVGEGIEKRKDDFAAEVAAQAGGNV